MRITLAIGVLGTLVLAGCGGSRTDVSTRGPYVASATGPISRACLVGGRDRANPVLCGCIQAVADVRLSGREQRRGARFFSDPHSAQETRQSDRPRDEAFWDEWTGFADAAARTCS
ncbi:hypothetical protein BCF33_2605 [Hasllibacter halocynthiae]|uniref:Arginine transporter n=1 Tax=Hasllibacter halocynthiae TaxID=595589 RepID=A0A2T0X455_9RHOB|nr:hypothetical protein [Hasllibacter halocynthiae]PRY93721.1 hypothetical protein BCF33_2605 [Hasllibacter halocynthiae]